MNTFYIALTLALIGLAAGAIFGLAVCNEGKPDRDAWSEWKQFEQQRP